MVWIFCDLCKQMNGSKRYYFCRVKRKQRIWFGSLFCLFLSVFWGCRGQGQAFPRCATLAYRLSELKAVKPQRIQKETLTSPFFPPPTAEEAFGWRSHSSRKAGTIENCLIMWTRCGDREEYDKVKVPLCVPLCLCGPINICSPNIYSFMFLWVASLSLWSPRSLPLLLVSGWHIPHFPCLWNIMSVWISLCT